MSRASPPMRPRPPAMRRATYAVEIRGSLGGDDARRSDEGFENGNTIDLIAGRGQTIGGPFRLASKNGLERRDSVGQLADRDSKKQAGHPWSEPDTHAVHGARVVVCERLGVKPDDPTGVMADERCGGFLARAAMPAIEGEPDVEHGLGKPHPVAIPISPELPDGFHYMRRPGGWRPHGPSGNSSSNVRHRSARMRRIGVTFPARRLTIPPSHPMGCPLPRSFAAVTCSGPRSVTIF